MQEHGGEGNSDYSVESWTRGGVERGGTCFVRRIESTVNEREKKWNWNRMPNIECEFECLANANANVNVNEHANVNANAKRGGKTRIKKARLGHNEMTVIDTP